MEPAPPLTILVALGAAATPVTKMLPVWAGRPIVTLPAVTLPKVDP